MGFIGPETYTLEQLNITVPKEGFLTDNEKVFMAGDMRRGQSLVIWAIYEGRSAAEKIDEYLMKESWIKKEHKMIIPFTKMEGAGNDYMYVNAFKVVV